MDYNRQGIANFSAWGLLSDYLKNIYENIKVEGDVPIYMKYEGEVFENIKVRHNCIRT